MTIPELDRLVTKTDVTPSSKKALRGLRRALMQGRVGDPVVGEAEWSIGFDTFDGAPIRMTFSFKRL